MARRRGQKKRGSDRGCLGAHEGRGGLCALVLWGWHLCCGALDTIVNCLCCCSHQQRQNTVQWWWGWPTESTTRTNLLRRTGVPAHPHPRAHLCKQGADHHPERCHEAVSKQQQQPLIATALLLAAVLAAATPAGGLQHGWRRHVG